MNIEANSRVNLNGGELGLEDEEDELFPIYTSFLPFSTPLFRGVIQQPSEASPHHVLVVLESVTNDDAHVTSVLLRTTGDRIGENAAHLACMKNKPDWLSMFVAAGAQELLTSALRVSY